jgi:hypothetical protein
VPKGPEDRFFPKRYHDLHSAGGCSGCGLFVKIMPFRITLAVDDLTVFHPGAGPLFTVNNLGK